MMLRQAEGVNMNPSTNIVSQGWEQVQAALGNMLPQGLTPSQYPLQLEREGGVERTNEENLDVLLESRIITIDEDQIAIMSLVDAFEREFATLCPVIDSQTMGLDFDQPERLSLEPTINTVIMFYILALGQVALSTPNERSAPRPKVPLADPSNHNLPGHKYFVKARAIYKQVEGGLPEKHGQSAILDALFLLHYGKILEGARSVNGAWIITEILIKSHSRQREHDDNSETSPRGKLSSLPRSTKLLYWACVRLNPEMMAGPSVLFCRTLPDYQVQIGTGWDDLTSSLIFIEDRIQGIRREKQLGNLYSEVLPTYKTGEGEYIYLRDELKTLRQWKRDYLPGHLAWDDEHPTVDDVRVANLRALYSEAMSLLLQPVLRYVLEQLASPTDFPAHDEWRQMKEDAEECVVNIIRFITAFKGVHIKCVSPLPDRVSLLHKQFHSALLLVIVYSSGFMPLSKDQLCEVLDWIQQAQSDMINTSRIIEVESLMVSKIRQVVEEGEDWRLWVMPDDLRVNLD